MRTRLNVTLPVFHKGTLQSASCSFYSNQEDSLVEVGRNTRCDWYLLTDGAAQLKPDHLAQHRSLPAKTPHFWYSISKGKSKNQSTACHVRHSRGI